MSYFRPSTLEDAIAVASSTAVKIAAGCTDLFPATSAQALSGPILDITGIPSLRGIRETESGWRIGATTTWTDFVRTELPPGFDALKLAAREVGAIQIQNAGTIAGNLCNASPAADGVPPLLALDASVEIGSQHGNRIVPLGDFMVGPRQTLLKPGELLVAIHVPKAAAQRRSTFLKLGARRYLVISIAMVAVSLLEERGIIKAVAIAVGSCGPKAVRLKTLEAGLIGQPATEPRFTRDIVAADLSPIDDVRATASYRLEAATELARRALSTLHAPPSLTLQPLRAIT